MKNEDPNTDKQLQDLFRSFEPPVPQGAWDGIAGVLDRRKNRRVMLWWMAAAALFVGGIVALWVGFSNSKEVKKIQTQETVVKQPNDKIKPRELQPAEAETEKAADKSVHADNQVRTDGNLKNAVTEIPNGDNKPKASETLESGDESIPEIIVSGLNLPNPFGIRAIPLKRPPAAALVALHMPPPPLYKVSAGKWSISAGVTQLQTGNGYAVNPDYSRYVHKNYLTRMKQGEQNMGSTGFAVQLGYSLKNRITLNAGVQFRQLNTRQQFSFSDEVPVTLMPGNKPDKYGNYPIIGYFGNTGNVSYSGFQRNTMVEIPVGMSMDLPVAPKWTIKPALGINTGFFSGVSGNTLDYQQLQVVSQQIYRFRTVQFSGVLSVGAFRQLNSKLQWGATLGAIRMLTPVFVPDASVRARNHALGLGTQLIWRID